MCDEYANDCGAPRGVRADGVHHEYGCAHVQALHASGYGRVVPSDGATLLVPSEWQRLLTAL